MLYFLWDVICIASSISQSFIIKVNINNEKKSEYTNIHDNRNQDFVYLLLSHCMYNFHMFGALREACNIKLPTIFYRIFSSTNITISMIFTWSDNVTMSEIAYHVLRHNLSIVTMCKTLFLHFILVKTAIYLTGDTHMFTG